MHPSSYVAASSGYKRYFCYPEVKYLAFDTQHYSLQNEKYCHSWLGWPSMPTQVTIEPHNHDVLLGRGGRNNQHSGNDILRQFGRVQGENYRMASKKGKSAISRLLIRQMRELNPPARFLRRVQQTATWEEVGEETAREKASQVLRDAVAGLLDNNNYEDASVQPLPTISAPVSVDEQDFPPRSRTTRKHPQDFYAPQPDREDSESKRRRYKAETATHVASSSHHHLVGCSPLRRHTELSYPNNCTGDIVYSHTHTYRSDDQVAVSAPHITRHNHGNLDEFALLHGELLESDVEDETSVFHGKQE